MEQRCTFQQLKKLKMSEKLKITETPLRRYPKLSQNLGIKLWVKHDDEIQRACGGNKVRKLFKIFNDSLKFRYNAIVTTGGIYSNHIRSAAILAAEKGWKARIVIHDRKPSVPPANLKIAHLTGANISFCKKKNIKIEMRKAMSEMRLLKYNPLYIWGGGHSASGVEAFQDAVLEIKGQCKKKKIKPSYIIVASGTGSTQAGLIAGSSKLMPNTKIIGISVSHNKLKGVKHISKSLEMIEFDFKGKIEFYDDFLAGGYCKTNKAQKETIRVAASTEGLLLDPIYTGKAFHGLKCLVKSGKIKKGSDVIFWHTGSLINLISKKLNTY